MLTNTEHEELKDIGAILHNTGGVEADSQLNKLDNRWRELRRKLVGFLRVDGTWSNDDVIGK